jgi:hypothetical protein
MLACLMRSVKIGLRWFLFLLLAPLAIAMLLAQAAVIFVVNGAAAVRQEFGG